HTAGADQIGDDVAADARAGAQHLPLVGVRFGRRREHGLLVSLARRGRPGTVGDRGAAARESGDQAAAVAAGVQVRGRGAKLRRRHGAAHQLLHLVGVQALHSPRLWDNVPVPAMAAPDALEPFRDALPEDARARVNDDTGPALAAMIASARAALPDIATDD